MSKSEPNSVFFQKPKPVSHACLQLAYLLSSYNVLDASESNVFVEVDHGNEASLYTSGPHGTLLSSHAAFARWSQP